MIQYPETAHCSRFFKSTVGFQECPRYQRNYCPYNIAQYFMGIFYVLKKFYEDKPSRGLRCFSKYLWFLVVVKWGNKTNSVTPTPWIPGRFLVLESSSVTSTGRTRAMRRARFLSLGTQGQIWHRFNFQFRWGSRS